MSYPSPPPATGRQAGSGEVRRRFARLRLLRANPRLRRRLLLGALGLILVIVAALAALARALTVLPIDLWFTQELQGYRLSPLTRVMYAVSFIGYQPWSTATVALGCALSALAFGWRDGAYLLAITVVQGLVNAAIKLGIGRPRPIDGVVEVFVPEHGYSFPSGHVMFYTVFFGFIAFLLLARLPDNRLRWLLSAPALALVALVGPSRIILGSHWLSDVVAAYLLGLGLLALAIELYLPRLAPPSPAAEGGLVGQYDEQQVRDG